jgi:hypothetical protein
MVKFRKKASNSLFEADRRKEEQKVGGIDKRCYIAPFFCFGSTRWKKIL